jgi:hypothetical protein
MISSTFVWSSHARFAGERCLVVLSAAGKVQFEVYQRCTALVNLNLMRTSYTIGLLVLSPVWQGCGPPVT